MSTGRNRTGTRWWTGPHPRAVELEQRLGDPTDADNPCGFAAARRRDERAEFPRALSDACGPELRTSFVPSESGGTLTTLDETLAMVRVAGRRDVTVMPATMFSITATGCVLLAGDERQRTRVLELIRSGGSVGFALSEPEHGSDLLANTCALTAVDGGGWRLDGRKWMVGLGARADAVLVVARSGGRGPAAFSAVLLEGSPWRVAGAGEAAGLAGMRGIDFAEFRFAGTPVEDDALVGRPGTGMETAMKSMQLIRTMSTAANLACADTGLRTAVDFARRYRVAGRRLAEHELTLRELGTAGAALLAGDLVGMVCARAAHTIPEAQPVHASVAKKVLTELSDEVFARCADVLGTRGLLGGETPAFDVARRDNAVVRHIDTGPVANIRQLAAQLGRLRTRGGAVSDRLARTFRLDAPLEAFDVSTLQLVTREDPVVAALAEVADPVLAELRGRDAEAAAAVGRVRAAVTAFEADGVAGGERFDGAERFCFLHAAASCVLLWWFNRHLPLFGARPGDAGWLTAVLRLLLDRANELRRRLPAECGRPVAERVFSLCASGRLLSAVPLPLAESAEQECGWRVAAEA